MNSNYDTAILFTHQSRMLCFLESLGVNTTIPISKPGKWYGKSEEDEQIRFKNGAIVKLELVGGKLHVSLVYAGELSEDKPKRYYFDTQVNPESTNYKSIAFPEDVIVQRIESPSDIQRIESTPKENIESKMVESTIKVIYLVRHGQAEHNVKKGFQKAMQSVVGTKDTSLTEHADDDDEKSDKISKDGQTQATNAGKHFFANLYQSKHIANLFVGVSDLKRTSETAAYFLYNAPEYNAPIKQTSPNFTQLHVIPCSHEIKQKESPCDGDKNMRSNENIMDCKGENAGTESCNSVIVTVEQKQPITFTKNWDFYDSFYGPGRRSGLHAIRKSSEDTQLCRNTNMILELLKCAESMDWRSINGGKSHKRKYKRLASKGKTKKRNRCHTKK